MAVFILTWNPDSTGMPHDRFEALLRSLARGETVSDDWSVNRKQGVLPGDHAYLLRQRHERGIVGAATVLSEVYPGQHWEDPTRPANYVNIDWDAMVGLDDRLTVEQLRREIPQVTWDRLQGSGVKLDGAVGAQLESLWSSHLTAIGLGRLLLPEEAPPGPYIEGAVSKIPVNRYERDPRARRACLAKWGYDCSVCGMNFKRVYGDVLGKDYIHVHHLKELSSLGPGYHIDPVKDLRPVCPNCHAMLHRQVPAYSIEELRRLKRRRTTSQ